MTAPAPSATALRVADLPQTGVTKFEIVPDANEIAQLQRELGLIGLRKVRLKGQIRPVGKRDWQLTADLGATVVQSCVATLEDVQTRIDTPVTRVFMAGLEDIDAPEIEMPEDDSVEALGTHIDPAEVLHEALALSLPAYPRADAADPVSLQVTEPGATPLTDEATKPFAALAGLRSKLDGAQDG